MRWADGLRYKMIAKIYFAKRSRRERHFAETGRKMLFLYYSFFGRFSSEIPDLKATKSLDFILFKLNKKFHLPPKERVYDNGCDAPGLRANKI